MGIEALNELSESTSLPAPALLKANAEGWAKDATVRLGEDYAKIVRALQALDSALSAPAGTRLVFDQDAAPTGWTRDTTINDRLIRIVSGARAHGGSWTISGLTVSGHALTVAELAVHSHGVNDPTHQHGVPLGTVDGNNNFAKSADAQTTTLNTTLAATGISIQNTGSGSAHTHGLTADGNWRPLHRDMLVASKD